MSKSPRGRIRSSSPSPPPLSLGKRGWEQQQQIIIVNRKKNGSSSPSGRNLQNILEADHQSQSGGRTSGRRSRKDASPSPNPRMPMLLLGGDSSSSPVEFVPKSILRRKASVCSTKFSDISMILEDDDNDETESCGGSSGQERFLLLNNRNSSSSRSRSNLVDYHQQEMEEECDDDDEGMPHQQQRQQQRQKQSKSVGGVSSRSRSPSLNGERRKEVSFFARSDSNSAKLQFQQQLITERSQSRCSSSENPDDIISNESEDPFGDMVVMAPPSPSLITSKSCGNKILLPDLNNNLEALEFLNKKAKRSSSSSSPSKDPASISSSKAESFPEQCKKNISILQEKEKELDSRSGRRSSSKLSSSSAATATSRNSKKEGVLSLPEQIHFKIFSFLNRIDLHSCTKVCLLWKEYHNTFYNPPRVFNGRSSCFGMNLSKTSCRAFLSQYILTTENLNHFKLFFYNVSNFQMKTIICERPEDFRNHAKHMTKLHLVNCNLHWQTLITLLTSLSHLNTFTDSWSVHYQKKTCVQSLFHTLHTRQASLRRLSEKLKLAELKQNYTRIKTLKISRRSFTKELCGYLQIISKIVPHLEEFQFTVGPWHTSNKERIRGIREWFPEFCKIFHNTLRRSRRSLKKLRITWRDEGIEDLFDKLVEALSPVEFLRLQELSLLMGDSSMRNPKSLPQLVRFFSDFKPQPGVNKILLVKVYIAPIFMTREWMDLFYTLQDRIIRRHFHVSLRVGVKLMDNKGICWKTVSNIFGNYVFFRGLGRLQVNVKNEGTESLREVIPVIKASFPNVESLEINVGVRKPGKVYAFRDYSVLSIAFNFKLITELRISDQPERSGDLLDKVVGRSDRASLTYAYISKRDMILLCEVLTRLRVLKLWANLNDLRDINFTGIKYKFFYLKSDGLFYVNKGMLGDRKEPSIQNLKHLKLLSLRGLGKEVTDITCRYGFEEMEQLQFLELTGNTSITQAGRISLHNRMRGVGCRVSIGC